MSGGPAYWAVVPAAGSGRRMGVETPTQYLRLAGRRVIDHTLQRLLDHPRIGGLVVALSADDGWWGQGDLAGDPRIRCVVGGQERCHSVLNALNELQRIAAADDWVLVHDAARPCLRHGDVDRLIDQRSADPVGGLLASPLHDTVKSSNDSQRVSETLPRERLWRAFTPQMFRLAPLMHALQAALTAGMLVTDEAGAMERLGQAPRLIEGHDDNIKITRPQDLELAAFYLGQRAP